MDWEALYQQKDTGWDRGMMSPALQYWLDKGALKAGQRVLFQAVGEVMK